ncbi:MAG: sulfurtransferase [SAR202 cluster bacterium]|nr:sulfurtransferase [SAR202 cluster bacterium]
MFKSQAHPEVLVSTEWVAQHLDDGAIVIAEVDSDLKAGYLSGHVPGAVGWGLHTDFEDQVARDIPSEAYIARLLNKAGITPRIGIVLYGDGNNRSATWAFWVLKYYGHQDVRLMDGGRKRWVAEGRPLTTEEPKRIPTKYSIGKRDPSVRAMREYIAGRLGRSGTKLLDTRTYEEFAGQLTSAPGTHQPDIYRKGRIPGAVHIPWDDASDKDGSFKPVEELRRMYLAKGIGPRDEVMTYCRLGVRASYTWFVLRYLLGYEDVKNYDGSWTEWGNSVGVPIETGQ